MAGGPDGLGGVTLPLEFRLDAVADLRLTVCGQALETKVSHKITGIVLIDPPCGVPEMLFGEIAASGQHLTVGFSQLRVCGAVNEGAQSVVGQRDQKKTFGDDLHEVPPVEKESLRSSVAQQKRAVKSPDLP